ncbi:hypothetical protein Pcinc_034902 [Petrolisthes cinctipes]|uniref:PLAT domain-containing protein n=1 Tax=Petrolisthes cinctipes TaxID=88211 RepID=A0AAE1C0T2_PETCI|nr:hypothetical protein Pcinc_034902 [Petrolisthes cinctipes]
MHRLPRCCGGGSLWRGTITHSLYLTIKTPLLITTTTTPYLTFRPYTQIAGGDIDKTIGGESSTSQQSHKGDVSTPTVEYIYRTYFSDSIIKRFINTSGCDQCESVIETGVPGERSVQREPGVDRENIAPKETETGAAPREENPQTTNMKKAFQLVVKTGDQEGAGTDANVWVVLEDEEGRESSKVKLDKILYNDLERSKRDTYSLECPSEFGQVARLKLKRDNRGLADDWFCDYIHVEDRRGPKRKTSKEQQKLQSSSKGIRNFLGSNYLRENAATTPTTEKTVYFFPIHRWVSPKHEYLFHEYGSSLPHLDPCLEARRSDLEKKRESYKYIVHAEGMVAQVST